MSTAERTVLPERLAETFKDTDLYALGITDPFLVSQIKGHVPADGQLLSLSEICQDLLGKFPASQASNRPLRAQLLVSQLDAQSFVQKGIPASLHPRIRRELAAGGVDSEGKLILNEAQALECLRQADLREEVQARRNRE